LRLVVMYICRKGPTHGMRGFRSKSGPEAIMRAREIGNLREDNFTTDWIVFAHESPPFSLFGIAF